MGLLSRKKTPKPEDYNETRTYCYDTPEDRISTAEWLFQQAKNERSEKEYEWRLYNEYYNFLHDTHKETAESKSELGVLHRPCAVPDPFIMVESQITPGIPTPEFHGRDDDLDSKKAKIREFAVRFVVENNRVEDKNTSNERRLKKYGDAFWKAYWDKDMPCGPALGDIRVTDIPLDDIYPDPTTYDLQDGEYVDYVYTMHKLKFWRTYCGILKKNGYTLDDIQMSAYREKEDLLSLYDGGTGCREDLVQILEHWFKQPFDDPNGKFEAGDIACSIQAGGVELLYIPKYWKETGEQCKLFPFVHYWCIKDETQFWNKGEIESIIGFVDAADRELETGLLNDEMTANDIVLIEEGALADGAEFTNIPGSEVRVRQGRMNGVARLGGLHDGVAALNMIGWLQEQIQRTNRNYDTNNGQETARVTTASGLLQLRADAQVQQSLKKSDRNKGFERLYELIDWLCLEFYDSERMLFIGAKDKGEEAQTISFDRNALKVTINPIVDAFTNEVIVPEKSYYPRVDVTVTAGDGLTKDPATTVEILDKLANAPVTADNYKLIAAELEYLDIPQKNDIINEWKNKFAPAVPPEIVEALGSNPELLEFVTEAITGKLDTAPEQPEPAVMPGAGQQGLGGPAVNEITAEDVPMGLPML